MFYFLKPLLNMKQVAQPKKNLFIYNTYPDDEIVSILSTKLKEMIEVSWGLKGTCEILTLSDNHNCSSPSKYPFPLDKLMRELQATAVDGSVKRNIILPFCPTLFLLNGDTNNKFKLDTAAKEAWYKDLMEILLKFNVVLINLQTERRNRYVSGRIYCDKILKSMATIFVWDTVKIYIDHSMMAHLNEYIDKHIDLTMVVLKRCVQKL
jgi:hypothetical protein